MVRVNFFASIARVASVAAIVSTLFIVFFSMTLFRRRSTVVAVTSRLAIASTVAVSVFRLVVVSAASVASRSTVGSTVSIVIATIVAASAVQSTPVVLPTLTLALAHLGRSRASAWRGSAAARPLIVRACGRFCIEQKATGNTPKAFRLSWSLGGGVSPGGRVP
jgi:hypothetical protein